MRPNLQNITVLLLVIASAVSALQHVQSTKDIERGAEALETWEERLAPVRTALPIQRGVIGYVSDWDVPGAAYHVWDQESEYLLAQYALAPLIVVKGPVAEWNVAVLEPGAIEIWQATYPGEYEVIRLKHNVYLLHKLNSP
jgi:hypothetical protein